MSSTSQRELDEFVAQQAAEDAFLSPEDREIQIDIVAQLLAEQVPSQPEKAQELLDKYLGHIALYRGERDANQDELAKVTIDLSKIGWLRDRVGKGNRNATIELGVEPIEAQSLSYDFVDLTSLDNVTKDCREKLEARNDMTRLMEKIKNQEIPQLWGDIRSGRGRTRPISVGGGIGHQQAIKAGRILNTEYPGYKLYVHRREVTAILLVLAKNSEEEPCFGLAALYEQKDQERIWSELMARKSSGRH